MYYKYVSSVFSICFVHLIKLNHTSHDYLSFIWYYRTENTGYWMYTSTMQNISHSPTVCSLEMAVGLNFFCVCTWLFQSIIYSKKSTEFFLHVLHRFLSWQVRYLVLCIVSILFKIFDWFCMKARRGIRLQRSYIPARIDDIELWRDRWFV